MLTTIAHVLIAITVTGMILVLLVETVRADVRNDEDDD
jgi:hypothetical protein